MTAVRNVENLKSEMAYRTQTLLLASELERRTKNSPAYARLLFDQARSPLLYEWHPHCVAYLREVSTQAVPYAVLSNVKALQADVWRRDALRFSRLMRGTEPSFVDHALTRIVVSLEASALRRE